MNGFVFKAPASWTHSIRWREAGRPHSARSVWSASSLLALLGLRRRVGHECSAFSLVEVMCAIAILAVALVGLTQGITTALSSSKESELQTAAALLAAGRIETLRAEGYLYDGVEEGQCSEDLAQYQWKQTITSTSTPGLHEVAVVVENARTGQAIYELRTLLFDPADLQTASAQTTNRRNQDRSKQRGERMR